MVRSPEGRAIGVWMRDDTVGIKVEIVQSQLPLGNGAKPTSSPTHLDVVSDAPFRPR